MNRKLHRIGYALLGLVLVAVFIKAFMFRPLEVLHPSDRLTVPKDIWQVEQLDMQDGHYSEYSCMLPEDFGKEMVLAVKSYSYKLKVFLNEKEIYTYEDIYMEKGFNWKWIELPEDAPGQRLTLQLLGKEADNDWIFNHNVLLGGKNTLIFQILRENLHALFWAVLIVLTGSIICIAGMILRGRVEDYIRDGVTYLGIFILLAGIWIVTDSQLLQFVTGRTAVVTIVSFGSFMLMPYFLLRFIEKMMLYKKNTIKVLANLHLANIGLCFSLYLLRLIPLHQMLFSSHILIVISILIVLRHAIVEIRIHNNSEMKKILLGLVALGLFGGIALVCFYIKLDAFYAIFYGIGILIFIIFLVGAVIDRLRYYLKTSASAEKYQRIANMDMMTGLGNRMAFSRFHKAEDDNRRNGCVIFDINNLKITNDSYGHQEGDGLIIGAAQCIKRAFGEIGECYRIGGDEFAAVLENTTEEEILHGLERLVKYQEEINTGRRIPIEIAYGYSMREDENVSFDDMVNEADANMYVQKQQMKAEKQESL